MGRLDSINRCAALFGWVKNAGDRSAAIRAGSAEAGEAAAFDHG